MCYCWRVYSVHFLLIHTFTSTWQQFIFWLLSFVQTHSLSYHMLWVLGVTRPPINLFSQPQNDTSLPQNLLLLYIWHEKESLDVNQNYCKYNLRRVKIHSLSSARLHLLLHIHFSSFTRVWWLPYGKRTQVKLSRRCMAFFHWVVWHYFIHVVAES